MEYHFFRHSSRVDHGWYDADEHLVIVEFPDGVRWEYRDVDEDTWTAFKRAPSAGHFLNETLGTHTNGPSRRRLRRRSTRD